MYIWLILGGINNYKEGQNTSFNFESWDTFAKQNSANPGLKVYLGVPAGATAGAGYVNITTLGEAAQYLQKTYSSFGGVMLWYVCIDSYIYFFRDCSQAWDNTFDGKNYAEWVKGYLFDGETQNKTNGTVVAQPVRPGANDSTLHSIISKYVNAHPLPSALNKSTLPVRNASTTTKQYCYDG